MVCVCECIRRVGCVLYTVSCIGHVPLESFDTYVNVHMSVCMLLQCSCNSLSLYVLGNNIMYVTSMQ